MICQNFTSLQDLQKQTKDLDPSLDQIEMNSSQFAKYEELIGKTTIIGEKNSGPIDHRFNNIPIVMHESVAHSVGPMKGYG